MISFRHFIIIFLTLLITSCFNQSAEIDKSKDTYYLETCSNKYDEINKIKNSLSVKFALDGKARVVTYSNPDYLVNVSFFHNRKLPPLTLDDSPNALCMIDKTSNSIIYMDSPIDAESIGKQIMIDFDSTVNFEAIKLINHSNTISYERRYSLVEGNWDEVDD